MEMFRFCADCGSKQVSEREDRGEVVRIYLFCKACRHQLTIFEGSAPEARKFKRLRRRAKRLAG